MGKDVERKKGHRNNNISRPDFDPRNHDRFDCEGFLKQLKQEVQDGSIQEHKVKN